MTDDNELLVLQAHKASERVTRWRWAENLIVFTAAVVLVGAVLVASWAMQRLGEIRDSQRQQACVARITASFQGAVADAFDTPPAPNPARAEAVNQITAAAKQLAHLDKTCP